MQQLVERFSLGVFRNLENRRENLPDDSPMAIEAHIQRGAALHEILENDPSIRVVDWGQADDPQPHEYVLVALTFVGPAVLNHVVLPGIKWLGTKLAEKIIDSAASEGVKHLVEKLWPKMTSGKIEHANITLPDQKSTVISISLEEGGTITIGNVAGVIGVYRNIAVDSAPGTT